MTSHPELAEIRQFPAPLRNVVAARLRSAIISGALKPGDRLIEARLAKTLKISRPSLREAMRQIEAEGLIEIVPNVGPIVRKPTLKELREIHDLREVVEGLCARYFAARGTEAAIDQLERTADLVQAALARADVGEIKKAKQAYYEAFTSGCGSEVIQKHVLQLVAMTSYSWGSSLSKPGRPLEGVNEMRRLVEAIRARQPEMAAAASQTLMRHASMTGLEVQAVAEANAAPADAGPVRRRTERRRNL